MRLKVCLAFLCCLAAVALVQSETSIEVDDNGDEYEVKRFNIEGRQLNGGRSQCVLTRRRRSNPTPSEEVEATNGNKATNNSNDSSSSSSSSTNRKDGQDVTTSQTTPPTNIDTNTQVDDDNFDGEDEGVGNENLSANGGEVVNVSPAGEEDSNQVGEDDYDYDEDEDEPQENAQFPLIVHKEGVSPQISQQVATESLNANGIVVVESNEPPKVNPDTHAVFQLLPVNHAIHAAANIEEDDSHLHFEEEISPVSTTAIWSTGADDDAHLDDLYDDYDADKEGLEEIIDDDKDKVKPTKNPNKKPLKKPGRKPTKRPNKGGKKKRKGTKNKNKIKNKNRNKNRNKNKKKRGNKKPPPKRRRPGQKNKRPLTGNRRGNKNKRRRPQSIRRPYKPYVNRGGNRRKNKNSNRNTANSHKQHDDRFNSNSNRRFNSDLNDRDVKRRRQNNAFVKDKGTRTFTKTETMTQTGTANDEKDVNCIIIRKDPPPTTARPFWNILGRDTDGTARSGPYGLRKRFNLQFVEKKE